MPEEPQNNQQQHEPTPHFDAFSGNKNEPQTNSTQNSAFNPNSNPIPLPVSETHITPTPVQNEPTTTYAPNPVVNPEFARVPDATNIQPVALVVSSGKTKWFKQKKFIIGIASALLLVLVGGGSAFAYVSYYQNPQKVISDSIINAITSKTAIYTGNLSVDNNDVKMSVKISSKLDGATGSLDADLTITASGKTYTISGSGLVDKSGDLYFKIDHLASIIAEAKTSIGITQTSSASAAIDKLVARIDGAWIKISSDDLKQYSEDTATSKTCINDTVKKFKDDKAAIKEVTDLYTKNPFILVDKYLGQVNGSFGYQLKGSNANLKTFMEGLKNTKIYKSLHNCDKTFVIDTKDISTKEDTNKKNNGTIKLWVDVWSHQITKIEINGTDSGTTTTATILPEFNQPVTVTAPAKSITLTELQTYIQDLMSTMYGSEL